MRSVLKRTIIYLILEKCIDNLFNGVFKNFISVNALNNLKSFYSSIRIRNHIFLNCREATYTEIKIIRDLLGAWDESNNENIKYYIGTDNLLNTTCYVGIKESMLHMYVFKE